MKATRQETGKAARGGPDSPAGCLTQPLRHVERLADGPPHGLRVHTIGERLVHRTATQPGQHEILGHAVRVGITELRPHPLPEHRQTHGARLPAAGGTHGKRKQRNNCELLLRMSQAPRGKIFTKHVANRAGARDDPPGRVRERTAYRPGNRRPTAGPPDPAAGTTGAGTAGPAAGITGSPEGSGPAGAPATGRALPAGSTSTA